MKSYDPTDCHVQIHRDVIDVSTISDMRPDPDWEYVDPEGHVHRHGDGNVPSTVEWAWPEGVTDGVEWHWEVTDWGEYRCTECGAPVEPGYLPDPESGYRKFMPGLVEVHGWVGPEHPSYRLIRDALYFGTTVDELALGDGVTVMQAVPTDGEDGQRITFTSDRVKVGTKRAAPNDALDTGDEA